MDLLFLLGFSHCAEANSMLSLLSFFVCLCELGEPFICESELFCAIGCFIELEDS